jgi:prefoldin subunit 5
MEYFESLNKSDFGQFIDKVNKELESIQENFNILEKQFETINQKLSVLEERMTTLEKKKFAIKRIELKEVVED